MYIKICHKIQSKVKPFQREFYKYRELASKTNERFILNADDIIICKNENTATTDFDPHYIYHTAWAARIIRQLNPPEHIDISSYLYFATLISAFVPVHFLDLRPASIKLSNLKIESADLCNLAFQDDSIESLSCMHVVEHIGLGRYGDALDYDGDLKAIEELKRVLKPEGNLLFVVPVGKPKILFNAHRIYSYEQIVMYFKDFKLLEFSLIPDNANETGIICNATIDNANAQDYGCGCFWFKKLHH